MNCERCHVHRTQQPTAQESPTHAYIYTFSPFLPRPSHFQTLSLSLSLPLLTLSLWFLKHSFLKHCKWPKYLVKHFLRILPSVEVRYRAMAEAGGLPKRKIDAEDGADALHKRRRISGSNFHEDRLQAVSSLSLKKSMIKQDQAKNQEIDEIMAQKKANNLLIDIADLLQNLQLVQENLTSLLEAHTKRKEELQHLLEETTGAGRNDQPHVKAATLSLKKPTSIPHFDPSFLYYVQDSSTVTLCLI
ncbi:hypothetical protein AMTRI_Chr06g174960 [Amborella trichopoda]